MNDKKKYCDYEDIPGTWSHELKNHFKAFLNLCWEGLNRSSDLMLKEGHDNKIDRLKWREYVLYDMQKRHDFEVNGNKQK